MMNWVLESMKSLPSFQNYQSHIDSIIENVYKHPTFSIELCKSVTEGICKTILIDKNITDIPKDFPPLVSKTIDNLNLNDHIDKEHLSVLCTRMKGAFSYISEIRNKTGNFASHGQDIEHQGATSDLSIFVLHSTNTILGFILHFYATTNDYRTSKRIRYEDYQQINDLIDEDNQVKAKYNISYSKALFDQDLDAYKELLIEYEQQE
ncbi:abortive infection family protein [Pelistega ratti]|uniref:abortive infection family protein n=1 Tax=Pelistega ratti TaxID=2652177 RepID=UPI00135AA140|nr:abortive infection family protein [Pelistega ratti]